MLQQLVVSDGGQDKFPPVDVGAVLLHPGGQADGGPPQLFLAGFSPAEAVGPGDGQNGQLLGRKLSGQLPELPVLLLLRERLALLLLWLFPFALK